MWCVDFKLPVIVYIQSISTRLFVIIDTITRIRRMKSILNTYI